MALVDKVRKAYERGGTDAVWKWCMAPDGPCRKAKRFGAAADWARMKRNAATGENDKKVWENRRIVYAEWREDYQEKCRDLTENCTGAGDPCWGGCRAFTNEAIHIVNGRVGVTSRKRTSTLGNPGSDHYTGNTLADAVDFGTATNYALRNEICRKQGITSSVVDYGSYYVNRFGIRCRIQPIAGTHGTGPHLHMGYRRVSVLARIVGTAAMAVPPARFALTRTRRWRDERRHR